MPRADEWLVAWALAEPTVERAPPVVEAMPPAVEVASPPVEMAPPIVEVTAPIIEAIDSSSLRERLYILTKRAVDVVIGTLLIAAAWPIMLITAVAIKCTSSGPILFRQPRAGRNGRPFVMYKFRSMHDGAEEDRLPLSCRNELTEGPCFKLRDDPRLTPIGRFLRQTSIDELPQLFNVFKGEMTLVGPRPLPLDEVCTGTRAERHRLHVRPGLTCLWQISGRCEIPYHEWVLLDLYYIEHRGLLLDLEILIKTVPAVLSRRGAF